MLSAADAAVMVLDAAKGIEPQTLKLFEVCRAREIPLLTFINKWDRPGRDDPRPARRDRAPHRHQGHTRHVARRHRRRFPRCRRPSAPATYIRYTRTSTRLHRSRPRSWSSTSITAAAEEGDAWKPGRRTSSNCSSRHRRRRSISETFQDGSSPRPIVLRLRDHQLRRTASSSTPSSTWCPGAQRTRHDHRWQAVATARRRRLLGVRVQGRRPTWTATHRDRIAFARVCSGKFERGMVVTHARTGKPFATKYAHSGVRSGARDGGGGLSRRRRRPRQRR